MGDSTSATSFTSLAHIVGFINTTYNTANPCWRRKYSYGPIGRGAQEIDLRVQLCEPSPGGVEAAFLRNEDLDLKGWHVGGGAEGSHGRRLAKMNCDWGAAIEAADFAVINTGLHHHGSLQRYLDRVNRTLTKLTAMYAQSGRVARRHLLYRSSWAALVGCGNLSDPLTPAQAAAAVNRGRRDDRYNWSSLSPQNDGVRALANAFGVPFWNVERATLLRPGGHRATQPHVNPLARDCVHYDLPGPPDGLTLQLLAYLRLL